jgi:hypothetical protein
MAEARERFDEPVYLEYDAPYYKVRVGDCPTEEQGDELLKVSRRLGYPDAWLVRTIISVLEEPEPVNNSPVNNSPGNNSSDENSSGEDSY